jgi:DNA modification methylase
MMINTDLFGNMQEGENVAAVRRQLERSVSQPGYNEAVNDDCMAVMQRYPDNYFELAIVDPPYGINVGTVIGGGQTVR